MAKRDEIFRPKLGSGNDAEKKTVLDFAAARSRCR